LQNSKTPISLQQRENISCAPFIKIFKYPECSCAIRDKNEKGRIVWKTKNGEREAPRRITVMFNFKRIEKENFSLLPNICGSNHDLLKRNTACLSTRDTSQCK
jgi:hypothetical protein